MKNIDRIKALLKEQIVAFDNVEKITNRILEEPIDDVPLLIQERGGLIERSVVIKDEISAEANGDTELLGVLNCSCDMSTLPKGLNAVFEDVLRINAAVNRISAMDKEVLNRIEGERDSVLKKIESLNSSSNAVAGNYKRAVETGFSQNVLSDTENIRTV